MTASLKRNRLKLAALSGLLTVVFGLSAHAGLYTFSYTDSGAIPQGGTTFSVEHIVSSIPSSISSIELVLTFNYNYDLTGNSSGIQGTLILNPAGTATYASFYPVVTSSGSGSQEIYDMTFSTFNGLNPNNTWTLNLWDNNTSGIENGLVSWTLDITAVPEPVNMALGIFAGLFILAGLWQSERVRKMFRKAAADS